MPSAGGTSIQSTWPERVLTEYPPADVGYCGGFRPPGCMWGNIMMRIFGQHGLQIFSSEHLCGKHNAHLQNKLFLFSDEATWAGDHLAERVLKGMILRKC
jgi:hypothetical protein